MKSSRRTGGTGDPAVAGASVPLAGRTGDPGHHDGGTGAQITPHTLLGAFL